MGQDGPVRVGIAGATGYAGQELLRLLARIRRFGDGRDGFERHRRATPASCPPSPTCGPVTSCRSTSTSWPPRPTSSSWPCPRKRRRQWRRRLPGPRAQGLRPLGRVPAQGRQRPGEVVSAHQGAARRHALRPHRARPATHRAPRGWCRARAAIRRPPRLQSSPWSTQASLPARSSLTRSPACPPPVRHRRAHPFLRSARQRVGLQGVRPPACRRNEPQEVGGPVTFVPHLAYLDRGILTRQSTCVCRRARPTRRLPPPMPPRPPVPASCASPARRCRYNQAGGMVELLRHRLGARRADGPPRGRVGHRQPRQGRRDRPCRTSTSRTASTSERGFV